MWVTLGYVYGRANILLAVRDAALLRFDIDDGKCALHFVDSRVFVGDDSFICEFYGQTVFLANKFIAGATEERL